MTNEKITTAEPFGQTEAIAKAMIRNYRAGLRDQAFHVAVRAKFPDCLLDDYNAAAD